MLLQKMVDWFSSQIPQGIPDIVELQLED